MAHSAKDKTAESIRKVRSLLRQGRCVAADGAFAEAYTSLGGRHVKRETWFRIRKAIRKCYLRSRRG